MTRDFLPAHHQPAESSVNVSRQLNLIIEDSQQAAMLVDNQCVEIEQEQIIDKDIVYDEMK